MDTPVLPSTAFLTVLLGVGLFFFIRASAKDRIEIAKLTTQQPQEKLLDQVQAYFTERAYRMISINPEERQMVFEGFVRPSRFLAAFLTFLAGVGILCLTLVLAILFPGQAKLLPGLLILSPIAGLFYWKKAGRSEQVVLRVEAHADTSEDPEPQSILTVTGHRDELAQLQRNLKLKLLESH